MRIDFSCGGAEVIDRIIIAYGFKTKLQLCNHLGMSSANLSMRYRRDFFPSDLVIRCMAETKASFEWLVTGQGEFEEQIPESVNMLQASEVVNGKLYTLPAITLDKMLLPSTVEKVELIKLMNDFYIVSRQFDEVFSGKYLVEIEGRIGIYDLQRYPVNRLKISGGDLLEAIECKLNEVKVLAKVESIICAV